MSIIRKRKGLKLATVQTILVCCVLALAGCPKVAQVTAVSKTVVASTVSTPVVFTGTNLAGKTYTATFVLDTANLTADMVDPDTAEPWLLELAKGKDPEHHSFWDHFLGHEGTNSAWAAGTVVVPSSAVTDTTVTVMTPAFAGLLKPLPMRVTLRSTGAMPIQGTTTYELTYTAPPKILKVTRYGDVNGQPTNVGFNGIVIDYPFSLIWDPNGNPIDVVVYTEVPSQVATPVAVDGVNIDDGARAEWQMEGVTVPGSAMNLIRGSFVESPVLSNYDGPARVSLKVTNKDLQTAILPFALLCLAPPTIMSVVREDAIGNGVLPYPAEQIPAEPGCAYVATIKLCGRNLAKDCGYVEFTKDDNDTDRTNDVVYGRTEITAANLIALPGMVPGDEMDCLVGIAVPTVKDLVTPTDVNVSLHFPDGSFTEEVAKAVGSLVLIPPPQLSNISPAKLVPATATTPDDDNGAGDITLTGSYIHPSSVVAVRWAYTAWNETADPTLTGVTPADNQASVWLGPNPVAAGIPFIDDVDWAKTVTGNTLTFVRPPMTTGAGSEADPFAPTVATKAHTDRITDDREVSIIVRDVWCQQSKPLTGVTYVAPPVIYAFRVQGGTAGAETPEDFVLTGKNWGATFSIEFIRRDTGLPLATTNYTAAADVTASGTLLTLTAVTPPIVVDAIPTGGILPIRLVLTNKVTGQRVVADVIYTLPNAAPLSVVNSLTAYPEIGSTVAPRDLLAALDGLTPPVQPLGPLVPGPGGLIRPGRAVTITGFNGNAVKVTFEVDIAGVPTAIGNAATNDNPINLELAPYSALGGLASPLVVLAPVMNPAPIADTLVFVTVQTADGQTTPKSMRGVIKYKAAPTVTAVATTNYAPAGSFPVTRRLSTNHPPIPVQTAVTVTGANLTPNEPFVATVLAPRAWLVFQGYAGLNPNAAAPDFGGWVWNATPLTFATGATAAAATAIGNTPLMWSATVGLPGDPWKDQPPLGGITQTQPLTQLAFVDMYGQSAPAAPVLTAVAGPAFDLTVPGGQPVFALIPSLTNPAATRSIAGVFPGRGMAAPAVNFSIQGSNLASVNIAGNGVQFFSTGSLPQNQPTTVSDSPIGVVAGLAFAAGPPVDHITGNITPGLTPDTLRADVLDAYVRLVAADGQFADSPAIAFCVPPVVTQIQLGFGPALSNTFITNLGAGPGPIFTLIGTNLNPLGVGGAKDFRITFAGAPVPTSVNMNSASSVLGVSLAFQLTVNGTAALANQTITNVLGPLPFNVVNVLGQTNEVGRGPIGLSPNDTLQLTSALSTDAALAGRMAAPNQAVVTGGDKIVDVVVLPPAQTGVVLPATNNVAVVSVGGAYQDPTAALGIVSAQNLRVAQYNGAATTTIGAASAGTVGVAQLNAVPGALPQLNSLTLGASCLGVVPGKKVVVGRFIGGDATYDVAVAVSDDNNLDNNGDTIANDSTGAVFIFPGVAAGGFGVPVKVFLPVTNPVVAARTVNEAQSIVGGFGVTLGVRANATNGEDLLVGCPGYDINPSGVAPGFLAGAGAIYVFAGPSIATALTGTVPTGTVLTLDRTNLASAGAGLGGVIAAGNIDSAVAGAEVLTFAGGFVRAFDGGGILSALWILGAPLDIDVLDYDGNGTDDVLTTGASMNVYLGAGGILANAPSVSVADNISASVPSPAVGPNLPAADLPLGAFFGFQGRVVALPPVAGDLLFSTWSGGALTLFTMDRDPLVGRLFTPVIPAYVPATLLNAVQVTEPAVTPINATLLGDVLRVGNVVGAVSGTDAPDFVLVDTGILPLGFGARGAWTITSRNQ